MRRNQRLAAGAGALVLVLGIVIAVIVFTGDSDEEATPPTPSSGPVAAAPIAPDSVSTPSPSSPAEQAAANEQVASSWTPAKVREALRNPVEAGPGASGTGGPAPSAPGSSPELSTQSTTPAGTAKANRTATAKACRQPAVLTAATGYPFKRSCYQGALNVPPARMVGKLLFDVPGGSGSCTATVAGTNAPGSPGNSSVVVTAGHCIGIPAAGGENSNGTWQPYEGLIFVPAPQVARLIRGFASKEEVASFFLKEAWFARTYPNTYNPVGFIHTEWKERGVHQFDFAAIVMSPREVNGRRVTIEKTLGGIGVTMGAKGANRPIRSIGYPEAEPFEKFHHQLFECRARSTAGVPEGDPREIGIGCDMSPGSSGGPWLANLGKGPTIVSVNSHGPPNLMFGPNLNSTDHWPAFDAARTL